jgi:acetyl-CoA carboxylase biotin carboxyl carrier protein
MNEREIKRLIRIVEESGIDELEVSRWGRSVRIVKRAANGAEQGAATTVYTVEAGGAGGGKPRPGSAPATAAAGERPGVALLRAPMVGTFYRAPSPEAPAYVDVGDRVRKGQTLCILEAMKLMNEIESEYEGEVVTAYIENGQPVQYGERLFAIRTS